MSDKDVTADERGKLQDLHGAQDLKGFKSPTF